MFLFGDQQRLHWMEHVRFWPPAQRPIGTILGIIISLQLRLRQEHLFDVSTNKSSLPARLAYQSHTIYIRRGMVYLRTQLSVAYFISCIAPGLLQQSSEVLHPHTSSCVMVSERHPSIIDKSTKWRLSGRGQGSVHTHGLIVGRRRRGIDGRADVTVAISD